jgi:hypothetical protein
VTDVQGAVETADAPCNACDGHAAFDHYGSYIVALLPRRTALAAILAIGVAGFQPMLAGTAAAATSLGTPTGLAPNSGSTPHKNPVLSWSPISGASAYQVELSRSDDWSDATDLVTLGDGGQTATATYAVPQTLVHAVYFWRVRAEDSSDKGDWSSDAQLDRAWADAPSLAGSNPTVNATVTQSGIATYPWRFAWTPIPDASTYEIEFSVSDTFAQPGGDQSGNPNDGINTLECLTANTSFTPYSTNSGSTPDIGVDGCDFSAFDPNGTTVYWRVRGIDDSQTAQVAAANQRNTLECFGVPNVEPGPPFPNPALTTGSALGSPTSVGQECSDWSNTKSVPYPTTADFYNGSSPLGSTGNVSGVSLDCPTGATSDYACATMPEISWQPVVGANEYEVTIADDSSFTNIEHSYTTEFLSLTPRDDLADYTAGSGYYVAVQACVDAGCTQAAVSTFTKRTPKVTSLAATKVQGGERLSWSDLANAFASTPAGTRTTEAEDYQVEVTAASDPQFDSPISTTVVDAACDASVETCYSPPATQGAGTDQVVVSPTSSGSFIWRVSPVDISGNVLPAATDSTAFTIDVTRPAFSITTKNGVRVTGPLTIHASEPVTGVSESTVHVVPEGGDVANAVAGKLTLASAPNTWEFRPKAPLATGETYVLSVSGSVRDQSGNSAVVTGTGVRTTRAAKDTSKGWTYSSGWTKHAASGARSGSYKSASSGHTASVVVAGSEAKLYACKGPSMGSVTIKVAGHSLKVSEHQSFTRCGVEIWHKALPKGEQTLTVKVSKRVGNIDEVKVA